MERNSSIELYRIIATFAVLVFHFNGWLVGGMPKHFDIDNISFFRISQAIIESCSCICVNMFLVISGYFGIHLKFQSVLRICLLLLFILVPFYIFDCLIFDKTFLCKEFIRKIMVISSGGYFIQCYFMLMLFSPILNAFVEKYEKKKGLYFVLILVLVEFWFDCITHTDYMGFRYGFSVLHFMIVYMVARYVNLYRQELVTFKKKHWIFAYLICTSIILLMYISGINYIWQYSNPIIILSAVCSFLPFIYNSFFNKWINWVSSSTLAVYIIHVNDPFYNVVVEYDKYILTHYQYPTYLFLAAVGVICVFIISILYDKLRLIISDPVLNFVMYLYHSRSNGKTCS